MPLLADEPQTFRSAVFLLVLANWGKLLGAVGMKDDHLMATAVNFFCI